MLFDFLDYFATFKNIHVLLRKKCNKNFGDPLLVQNVCIYY